MGELVSKKDIQGLDDKIAELTNEHRKTSVAIMARIDERSENIISVVFSESKKIREEIGYQAILLKTLEDNLKELQFDDGMGVSSKIEVSVGGELFGTGAKWVLDIDIAKASHTEILANILEAIQLMPAIPQKVKEKAASKLEKLLKRN